MLCSPPGCPITYSLMHKMTLNDYNSYICWRAIPITKVDDIIRDQRIKMACIRTRQMHEAIDNGDFKKAKRYKILTDREIKKVA